MIQILKGTMTPNNFTIKDVNYTYTVGRDRYVVNGKLGFYNFYFLINPTTLGMQGKEFIDVNGNIITVGNYGIQISYSVAVDMKDSILYKDNSSVTAIPSYLKSSTSNEGYLGFLEFCGSAFLPDNYHLLPCDFFTENFSHAGANHIPDEPTGFYWAGNFIPVGYIHVPDGQGVFYGYSTPPTEISAYPSHQTTWVSDGNYLQAAFVFDDTAWLDPERKYLLPKLNTLNFASTEHEYGGGNSTKVACTMFIPYDPTNPEPSPTLLSASDLTRVGNVHSF